MSAHFAPNLHSGSVHPAGDEWIIEEWHRAAIADTGVSYAKLSRVAVVRCLWCDDLFVAKTMADAMYMFRDHEQSMLDAAHRPSEVTS